ADVPDTEPGVQPDAEYDPGVSLSRMRYPSSIGLTFAVDPARTKTVELTLSADRYEPVEQQDEAETGSGAVDAGDGGEPLKRRTAPHTAPLWRRLKPTISPVSLDVTRPASVALDVAAGLRVRAVVRAAHRG